MITVVLGTLSLSYMLVHCVNKTYYLYILRERTFYFICAAPQGTYTKDSVALSGEFRAKSADSIYSI